MRLIGLALAALLLLYFSPSVAAEQVSGYYELRDRTFIIKESRLLFENEKIILFNSSPSARITSVSWFIPSTDVRQFRAWDDVGNLTTTETTLESGTVENIYFRGEGIVPNSKLTFYLSYTVGGIVKGRGVEYRASLGGVTAGDLRYDNYVVTVIGPPESSFFLSNPPAELINPRTVRYSTSIAAHEAFDGLLVRFYEQPAFYKLRIEERFKNNSTSPTTNLMVDAMLFTEEAGWQFSALASSSHPIKTMYLDQENNWHGVFEVGEVAPGSTETIWLELLYEVRIHDPGISPQGAGLISEMPAWLEPYLNPLDKWESNSPIIRQKAAESVGGEDNVYLAMEQILNFVAESLEYQRQDNRYGALWALRNGIGDCSEYSDLAIALARAAGIPTRAMYGWAFQEDDLGPHGWIQFYLPNRGWQPADPTWAETSGDYLCRLDPTHLTRNVRGLSSEESGATTTYYGELAWTENAAAEVLSRSDAALYYVSAAQYAVNLADALLRTSPDESLQARQNDAKRALAQAQTTTDENQKIFYAKSSLQSANGIIRALGKKPAEAEGWPDLKELLPLLVGVGGIAAVVAVVYAIMRRR